MLLFIIDTSHSRKVNLYFVATYLSLYLLLPLKTSAVLIQMIVDFVVKDGFALNSWKEPYTILLTWPFLRAMTRKRVWVRIAISIWGIIKNLVLT